LATSSRTPPLKPSSSTRTRWREWRLQRRLSGPRILSSRGLLIGPAISTLCFDARPQTPLSGGVQSQRSRLAVLHLGHDRTTQRRHAQPPQSHRDGGELPRGHLCVQPK
jgi:hypothetical protein